MFVTFLRYFLSKNIFFMFFYKTIFQAKINTKKTAPQCGNRLFYCAGFSSRIISECFVFQFNWITDVYSETEYFLLSYPY